jgi:hypothetical protein
MSKLAALFGLALCTVIATGALTGCSVGPLPGGSPTLTANAATPSPADAKTAPSTTGLDTVPNDCPQPSDLTPILKFTVLNPTIKREPGVLDCTYSATYKGTTTRNVLEITFRAEPASTPASTLKAIMEKSATDGNQQGGKATVAALPGLGRIAYTFADHEGNAGVLVLNGNLEFGVAGGNGLESVESVARLVISE